jgi:two-component system cell cycle response regulator
MSARVLVVDDIPANVKLLETKLSAEYFDVLTASSGPDALAICEQGLCDLVLLDVMMPDMDGFEVCRRLKGRTDDRAPPRRSWSRRSTSRATGSGVLMPERTTS